MALNRLADQSERDNDHGAASSVCNQAALLASDVGFNELAREMCHAHAEAYLTVGPLSAMDAIRGLEPLVNLARLDIRAGEANSGLSRLDCLFAAVSEGLPLNYSHIPVPANLVDTAEDRQEVRAWLWRVLLADGTRTLTSTGRWSEAEAHIERHRGVGLRMLDGRQVAVIAALVKGDHERAAQLITDTEPGEPWEGSITHALNTAVRIVSGAAHQADATALVAAYLQSAKEPGRTVFDIRLGLTALDLACQLKAPADAVAHELAARVFAANDGYAARELLAHPACVNLLSEQQTSRCRDLVDACALGAGRLPEELLSTLQQALRTAHRVLVRRP
ncbi:hypothetical protein [Streptomyces sp. NPDC002564]|uniref:hypothetical protein n=1 Tax=Streptomyces sp. NPDC002564 TaxID=3364649 RepID=UPI0036AC7837